MLFNSIMNNRIPGQLVVQMTDRCNARCPQCGMRVTERFPRSSLATDRIKTIIDQAADRGVQAISFTGGEPLLELPVLIELIRHAGAAGIRYIRTGTNGFLFRDPQRSDFERRVARVVEGLADTPLRNFWISLDSGIDAVHEQMRGFPGVVAGIAKALPMFHQAGLYPAANLGINRNVGGEATRSLRQTPGMSAAAYLDRFYHRYRQALDRFYQRAADIGFTMANTCYPMSIDNPEHQRGLSAVYAATTVSDIVRFTPHEKRMVFSALIASVRRFRSRLRIFSPLCALESMVRQYASSTGAAAGYGCRGGVDFFFIHSSDGHVYPCGYRGQEDMGDLGRMDIRRTRPPADPDACRKCDWECFRDPSALFGPLLALCTQPWTLVRRTVARPEWVATWVSDLLYYRACEFFDGRRPPDSVKLRRYRTVSANFSRKPQPATAHGLTENDPVFNVRLT